MAIQIYGTFELHGTVDADGMTPMDTGIVNMEEGSTLTFHDAAGFDGATGFINCNGVTANHVTITGDGTSKNSSTMKWDTVEYTDISYLVEGLTIANGHTPTSIADDTVDNCTTGVHAYGSFDNIDNIEITNCTSDVEVDASKTLTVLDSNFDETKVAATGGLFSKNHNDVANEYYIWGQANTNNTSLIPLSSSSVMVKASTSGTSDAVFGANMANNVVLDIEVEDTTGSIGATLGQITWYTNFFNHGAGYGNYNYGSPWGLISKGVPIPFTSNNQGEIKNGKEMEGGFSEIMNLPEMQLEDPT